MTRSRSLLAILSIVSVAACSGTSSAPQDTLARGHVRVEFSGGLVQRVTLIPAVLVDGRDVQVRSVLVNTGNAPLELTSRICGLDYAGTLQLSHPPEVLKCAGYSATATLAPGDSVVGSDIMRVSNTTGEYELRVRHAVAPDQWASMQVVVRTP
jgi:hypothetical protein